MSRSLPILQFVKSYLRFSIPLAVVLGLAACVSPDGANYQNDAAGSRNASDFVDAPDAIPRDEPINPASTRPYSVFGKEYVPLKQRQPLVESGNASWYGKQFHGRQTSIGETYDMYAMSAAHPTLPLPSYVRVVNALNGRSVVVRVNDRGPFVDDHIIDLSFAAAAKLGYIDQRTAPVALEVVDPMVVTLVSLRERIGLPTDSIEDVLIELPAVQAAAGAASEPGPTTVVAAGPNQSGAVSDARPGATVVASSTTADSPEEAVAGTRQGLQPSPVPGAGATLALTTAAPLPVGSSAASAAAGSDTAPAAPVVARAEPPQPEPLKLSARAPRRIADVLLPQRRPDGAPERFVPGEPPIIEIEPFEGSGLRPARAERYQLPRTAPPPLALATDNKKEEPFVIPYKDRLPKEPKGASEPARVYLQLGAYDTEKAAREALTQAGSGLPWLAAPVNLLEDRGLHKLQAGPFASSRSAKAAARRIRREGTFSPFYVFR